MFLNISELLKMKGSQIPFDIIHEADFIKREDFEVKLKSPLKISGISSYDGKIVNLKGNISALITAQCSRCLEPFDYQLDCEFDENFSKFGEDEEIYHFDENVIDLTDMVIDNIILSMPLKLLCGEECRGLCPVCGNNLNKNQCDCDKDNIDLRLSVLKDLFKGD